MRKKKMGLISADELKRWLDGFKETDNISPVYMRTLIDSQPTVEAIPVKWLEDYQIKEFIKADPNSVEFQRACGVGCAIEAWRKEDEMR